VNQMNISAVDDVDDIREDGVKRNTRWNGISNRVCVVFSAVIRKDSTTELRSFDHDIDDGTGDGDDELDDDELDDDDDDDDDGNADPPSDSRFNFLGVA